MQTTTDDLQALAKAVLTIDPGCARLIWHSGRRFMIIAARSDDDRDDYQFGKDVLEKGVYESDAAECEGEILRHEDFLRLPTEEL